jgi:hypothetical protein
MSTRQWQRLARVYFERARRPIFLILATLLPLCLLFARKDGYPPRDLVLNFSLVAALLPFSLGGVIMRSKADGTLAFVASLPVSRDDHAKSWLTVVVALSLPLAIVVMTMCSMAPLEWRGALLVASGISATLLIASAVMTLNAFQLSVRPTMAGVYFVNAMAVLTMIISLLSSLLHLSPAAASALVQREGFLVGVSALVWVAAGAAFWWSWRRIGHYLTNYVGEPPKA